MNNTPININATPGEEVSKFLIDSLGYSKHINRVVQSTHNERTVTIYPDSCIRDIYEKFNLIDRLYRIENNSTQNLST